MATLSQITRLGKKFKNIQVIPLDTSEDKKVDVFCIKYQKHGVTPSKMSEGLIEANAMWDERQSRPPGYFIIKGFEKDNGHCTCIMVSEEWLDTHNMNDYTAGWAAL